MTTLSSRTPLDAVPSTADGLDRERRPTRRHYIMCPPAHFAVRYAINPWMDLTVPVDVDRAMHQWDSLRQTYLDLGHRVDVMTPDPDLPDMVFAANGALVVGDRAFGARFTHPERAAESALHRKHLQQHGIRQIHTARHTNEGEGDFLVIGDTVLAGTGFRTSREAHTEAAAHLQCEVVSLELVDPRFYHLDTCLAVLSHTEIAYYPPAFSETSRRLLQDRYPDAVIATERDALVLGLNAVSDDRHVVLARPATDLAAQLRARRFHPIPVDLSELVKAGGNVKCCTLEVHR